MSKTHLSFELRVLLQLSAPSITAHETEIILRSLPISFNWQYFIDRAIATKLAGYLLPFPQIAQQYIPAHILKIINGYQQVILLHSTLLRSEITELTPKLDRQHLDHALLKGWDLHFRYGYSLKERQISDIDLLIDEKDLKQLELILIESGYELVYHNYKSRFHHKWLPTHAPLSARKAGMTIDIHTSAFAKEHGISIPLNLHKKVKINLREGGHVWVLNETEAYLFLAFHAIKHFEALHEFKAAQIRELRVLDIQLGNLQLKEQLLVQKLFSFLNRYEKLQLDPNELYDVFFSQQLSGGNIPLKLQMLRLRQRLKLKTSLSKSAVLCFFDLFPKKTYLRRRYGQGNYWVLNLKRLQKSSS